MNKRFLSIPVLLAGLVAMSGCFQEQPDVASNNNNESSAFNTAPHDEVSEPTQRTEPTLLTKVSISPTHEVSFYELEGGGGLVQEMLDADLDQGSVLPPGDAPLTLGEIYRHVTGEVDTPAELMAADQRASELPALDEYDATPMLPANGAATESIVAPPPSATCRSYDWNLDKTWFLNNYCNQGYHHDCVVDWSAINSWNIDTSYFKVVAFDQSFEATAHFWGGHQHCWTEVSFPDFWNWVDKCEWTTDFDVTVQTRKIGTVLWTGNGRRYAHLVGAQPCAHVGMAQMWSLPSEAPPSGGGSSPIPNPGLCNDVGEACCWNGVTSNFYCDAVYDPLLQCNAGYCGH